MYVSKMDPLGPDLETTWGSYQNPFFTFDQVQYANRGLIPVPPSELRGQQPRWQQPASAASSSPFGAMAETPTDEKWQLIVLLGIVGLIAYLIGKGHSGGGAKSNPGRSQRRRSTKSTRKNLRRIANARPRDAAGRFI